jgi:hypothetical protein
VIERGYLSTVFQKNSINIFLPHIHYLGDCPPYLRQIRQFRGRGDTPAGGSIGYGGVYEGIWEVGVYSLIK